MIRILLRFHTTKKRKFYHVASNQNTPKISHKREKEFYHVADV